MQDNRGLWRAKRKDNGEWIEGVPYDKYMICGMNVAFGDDEVPMSEYPEFDWVEIDLETLGEYTCLRDKNRKLIFEGDIIAGKLGKFTIAYSSKIAAFIAEGKGVGKLNMSPCLTIGTMCFYEVIGNIYDNPELLEGGENNG